MSHQGEDICKPRVPTTPQCVFGERIYTEIKSKNEHFGPDPDLKRPMSFLIISQTQRQTQQTTDKDRKIPAQGTSGAAEPQQEASTDSPSQPCQRERGAQFLPRLWASNVHSCGMMHPCYLVCTSLVRTCWGANKVSPGCPTSLHPHIMAVPYFKPIRLCRWNPAGS